MRRLAIALITYGSRPERTEYALRTIAGIAANLQLADAEIGWYVADDGSPAEHYEAVKRQLVNLDQRMIGTHHERMGPGVSQNHAANHCFAWSDMALWMEDDWELRAPYDITAHYDVCQRGTWDGDERNIGIVRMGYMTHGVAGICMGRNWQHYLWLSRATQYSFSGHPALRHRRFWDAIGPYDPRGDAGFCEIDMDARWRAADQGGPGIVWPMDGPGEGRFIHIGGAKA